MGRTASVVVPPFASAQDVKVTYALRRDIRGLDGQCPDEPAGRQRLQDLYPRDGFNSLQDLERDIGELVGVSSGKLLAYSSGMTAIVSAIESAHPTSGTTILMGQDHYTETPRYVDDHLRPRGVKVVRVDSGDSDAVKRAIDRHSPGIILFETVANGTGMPVLDTISLFRALQPGRRPLVVLDNTLPTPTLVPAQVLLDGNGAQVVVVESGTKSYALNSEMLGILYTNDGELWTRLFSGRVTIGNNPTPSSVDTIRASLPPSKREFDSRNRRIFRNTLALAQACLLATEDSTNLIVVHPNLPGHPNYSLAQAISHEGTSPVFYINNMTDQFKLTDLLFEDPVIRQYCEISQSFGFSNTRIYPYYGNTYVRIAGGAAPVEEIEELSAALTRALKRA